MIDEAGAVLLTKTRRLKYAMIVFGLAGLVSAIGEIVR
jgi:hypothetical protein